MSDFQQHQAAIGDPAPDWDQEWENSTIPEKGKWRRTFSEITQAPDLAERLVSHGWTWGQFNQALTDSMYLIGLGKAVGPTVEANFIVLADAVAQIHNSRSRLALELRQQTMRDLSLPTLDEGGRTVQKGWTFDRIGALVGLTKQRAREIAKPKLIERGFGDARAASRSKAIAAVSEAN